MTHTQGATQFGFERLDVWHLALEAMQIAHEIADAMPRGYAEMADQLRRASRSVVGNIGEGVGKNGRDQARFFLIARGSACESAAVNEAGRRLGIVSSERHARLRALLLRVVGALTALSR